MLITDDPNLELVGEASDGQEAIRAVQALQPDLLLMDIKMPESGGVEACRIVQERSGPRNPHVVVLTANAIVGDREKYLHWGFDGYRYEPLNVTELRVGLQRAGKSRRSPS